MRWVLRAGALGSPIGMGWGGRREGGSGWGTHVNTWLVYVNIWQNPLQYCKVISLQPTKINEKKIKEGIGQALSSIDRLVSQMNNIAHAQDRVNKNKSLMKVQVNSHFFFFLM